MEQPPTPHQPDLPQPPIFERPTGQIPPVRIPSAQDPDAVRAPAPAPPSPPVPPQVRPAITAPIANQRPPIVPDVSAPGPAFAERSFMAVPASGAGTVDRPQWPSTPPTGGANLAGATPQPEKPRRRRLGVAAVALLLAAAVAAGGFFFGRSFASSESTTTQVAAPTETVAPPALDPTVPPVPTQVPETPSAVPAAPIPNDSPVPLPADTADEPVAAVAQAVAPAVVLIQNDIGQGSGIIYDESGLILTNAHVVGSFTEVQVTLASGVRVPGVVLGADPLTDVAVIDIDTDSEFGVAVLAPDSTVEVGQLAVAIGSPFGLEQTVTSGIVSAKGRVLFNPVEGGGESVVAMIQTDAPINPGNSGGALADRQGRVIGMNTSIRTDGSGGNIGVGFAIPSDTAKIIADRIISGEPLEQGFLGVASGGTPLIGEPGAVIGEVTPGAGAANAGLLPGDRIVQFNEIEIKSMTDLAAAVRLQPPGATVVIDFVRDEERLSVNVTLGTFEDQG